MNGILLAAWRGNNVTAMIKNYLLVAWRNLVRNRIFSTINILGLALGLACNLSILLWVQDEKSVDAFHRNGDRLYNVYERNYMGGKLVMLRMR
jgi:putative ABC transport system permease protein